MRSGTDTACPEKPLRPPLLVKYMEVIQQSSVLVEPHHLPSVQVLFMWGIGLVPPRILEHNCTESIDTVLSPLDCLVLVRVWIGPSSEQDLEMMGFYKNGALLDDFHVFNKEWWSQRFFWTRSIRTRPHCVVFVFDGSLDPFFSGETIRFFSDVFRDCLCYQYEPIVVVTCLDIIYKQAIENGRDFSEEVDRRKDAILTAFHKLNFNNARIHFVTNFNQGDREGLRLWDNRDEGFSQSENEFVKLYKELLESANLFLSKNLTQESTSCTLL